MMVREGKKFTGPEQVREAAQGCARIRGDTLGIAGLGKLSSTIFFFKVINKTYNHNYVTSGIKNWKRLA